MALQVGQLRKSALSVFLRGAGSVGGDQPHPSAADKSSAEPLEGLGWKDVERLVARLFHRDGFSVLPVSERQGPVDFLVERGGERVFVQCRNWNVWQVPDRAVREMAGYMSGAGASRGYMLSTGEFSEEARTYAGGKGLALIGGAELPRLLAA